jgi:hypothetical protein
MEVLKSHVQEFSKDWLKDPINLGYSLVPLDKCDRGSNPLP